MRTSRMLASYAVAGVLLWLFVRNTDWQALADSLPLVGWPLLAAAIAVRLASLVVSALRWQALLDPTRHVGLRPMVAVTMMGMTASAIMPMQAAELVRPYLLSRREGVDFSATMGTVTVEWFLDAVAIFALFIPAALWQRLGASGAGGLGGAWFASAVLVLSLAFAALAALRLVPRWAARVSGSTRRRERLQSFATGLRTLDGRRGLMTLAAYSLLLSALTAVSAWLALAAFALPVSFLSGFLLLGLVTVAGMIPTPGAIGGFHAVCQLALVALFHIDRASTVLPVIALHAVLYAPAALVGALCFLSWPGEPQRSEG
jgi:glycosyltransferase 2 family protein